MRRAWAVAVLAALTACGGGAGKPATPATAKTHDLMGTMAMVVPPQTMQVLRSGAIGNGAGDAVGQPCTPSRYAVRFSDIDQGSSVVVKNEKDVTIASGRLSAGHWTTTACEMPFIVSGVPDANFYSVEVSNRGVQRFSRAEMDAMNWTVALSLNTG